MSRSMFTCLENRKDKQSTASAAKRACVSRRSSFLDMRSKMGTVRAGRINSGSTNSDLGRNSSRMDATCNRDTKSWISW